VLALNNVQVNIGSGLNNNIMLPVMNGFNVNDAQANLQQHSAITNGLKAAQMAPQVGQHSQVFPGNQFLQHTILPGPATNGTIHKQQFPQGQMKLMQPVHNNGGFFQSFVDNAGSPFFAMNRGMPQQRFDQANVSQQFFSTNHPMSMIRQPGQPQGAFQFTPQAQPLLEGVYPDPSGTWQVYTEINGMQAHVGSYSNVQQATECYANVLASRTHTNPLSNVLPTGDSQNNLKTAAKLRREQEAGVNAKRVKPSKKSKYRGVSWHKRDRRWLARLWTNHQSQYLGSYSSEVCAALAVDLKVIECVGNDNKRLNFPIPEEREKLVKMYQLKNTGPGNAIQINKNAIVEETNEVGETKESTVELNPQATVDIENIKSEENKPRLKIECLSAERTQTEASKPELEPQGTPDTVKRESSPSSAHSYPKKPLDRETMSRHLNSPVKAIVPDVDTTADSSLNKRTVKQNEGKTNTTD